MEMLRFIFGSFWVFVGVLILLYVPIQFLGQIIYRLIRQRTIIKMGYPPEHCDADGDFKKVKDED